RALAWSGTADSVVDLQELLPPGYTFSRAYSIDQSGNIFGIATAVDGTHAVEWVPVPEPASFVLLWIGAGGLLCWRRIYASRVVADSANRSPLRLRSAAGFVFFWLVVANAPAWAQTIYNLGTLGGSSSYGYAVNASGQVAGKSDGVDGNSHA